MVAVYTAAKIGGSFNQHKNFLKAFKRRHLDVGNHCHHITAARRMCQGIYERLHKEFLDSLKKSKGIKHTKLPRTLTSPNTLTSPTQ